MTTEEETAKDATGTTTTPAVDETTTSAATTTPHDDKPSPPSFTARLCDFYWQNEFLILVICAICLARAYPPLGAEYLAPDITATWIAVCIIFVMAGLGLKTEEFRKAFQQIWFNLFVQGFNFGVVSASVYLVSLGLKAANILSDDLADGLVVAACLPMTINMVLVLTKAGGGDESLAIVNAASGNLVGVFLSPVLILGYLGVEGDIDLASVFVKLVVRVVIPVAVGQVIQKTMPKVVAFYKTHKKRFKRFQEYCLVFIVYTVFCRTFEDGSESSIGDVFLTILFVFLILISLMVVAWYSLKLLYRNQPEMRVMGLYGCTHKTVAMGVPLINAIYEDNSAVGLYTLPLLIWHPMQLVIGTFLAPRLTAFVESERRRLDGENPPTSSKKEEDPESLQPPASEVIPKDEPSTLQLAEASTPTTHET
eukprot:CAMPEP_0172447304 /NCGR_PEP_ID=MMETSP1065-20121228/6634_1 /TAXON_ID=265537 /ORGANISM="Amphiprora paludosa, Strain CCMP125" /LENGTH=423 /DNA_ID=CAMNT_0013198567 /DNA_START=174 /DNA_END=1445 /DNA_ORIENTATION=+